MKKQATDIEIKVPLQRHLAKFWRMFHPQPVRFDASDDYGLIIKALISLSNSRNPTNRPHHRRNHGHHQAKTPHYLPCVVSRNHFHRWRLKGGIRQGSIAAINNWLEGKFDLAFFEEVNQFRDKGHNIKTSIELFCAKYGLCDDDILFETLKKKEYRHRLTQLYDANNPTRQHP